MQSYATVSDLSISSRTLIVPGIEDCDPSVILQFINNFRKNKAGCDVKLVANNGAEILAHKAVLSTNSEYFKATFTGGEEETQHRIIFTNVDEAVLNLIVDFLYGSEIVISDLNVEVLLKTSDFFGITYLKRQCCQFLTSSLTITNCYEIQHLGELYTCEDLLKSTENFMAYNFCDLITHRSFLEFPVASVIKLLKRKDINIDREDKVYTCAMEWIKYDIKNREIFLSSLMKFVRLPLINKAFLVEVVAREPLLRANLKCQLLLNDAFSYKLLPKKAYISNSAIIPRLNYFRLHETGNRTFSL